MTLWMSSTLLSGVIASLALADAQHTQSLQGRQAQSVEPLQLFDIESYDCARYALECWDFLSNINDGGTTSSSSSTSPVIAQDGDELVITWRMAHVIFSYFVSFLGALVAVELNETRRMTQDDGRRKTWLTGGVAFCLGTGAIWCMHFVGMAALQLETQSGVELQVDFDAGMSFVSWAVAVASVLLGVTIASRDQYFGLVERRQLVDHVKLVLDNCTFLLCEVNEWKIAKIILLSKLQWIVLGGVLTGGGVCAMHYIGMESMVFDAEMHFNPAMVLLSVILAAVTATTAYWFIFRMLVFKPSIWYRLTAVLVAAIAVCSMHYTGMHACTYRYKSGRRAAHTDTAISTENNYLIAVWLSCLLVASVFTWLLTDVRKKHRALKSRFDRGRRSSIDAGGPTAPNKLGSRSPIKRPPTVLRSKAVIRAKPSLAVAAATFATATAAATTAAVAAPRPTNEQQEKRRGGGGGGAADSTTATSTANSKVSLRAASRRVTIDDNPPQDLSEIASALIQGAALADSRSANLFTETSRGGCGGDRRANEPSIAFNGDDQREKERTRTQHQNSSGGNKNNINGGNNMNGKQSGGSGLSPRRESTWALLRRSVTRVTTQTKTVTKTVLHHAEKKTKTSRVKPRMHSKSHSAVNMGGMNTHSHHRAHGHGQEESFDSRVSVDLTASCQDNAPNSATYEHTNPTIAETSTLSVPLQGTPNTAYHTTSASPASGRSNNAQPTMFSVSPSPLHDSGAEYNSTAIQSGKTSRSKSKKKSHKTTTTTSTGSTVELGPSNSRLRGGGKSRNDTSHARRHADLAGPSSSESLGTLSSPRSKRTVHVPGVLGGAMSP